MVTVYGKLGQSSVQIFLIRQQAMYIPSFDCNICFGSFKYYWKKALQTAIDRKRRFNSSNVYMLSNIIIISELHHGLDMRCLCILLSEKVSIFLWCKLHKLSKKFQNHQRTYKIALKKIALKLFGTYLVFHIYGPQHCILATTSFLSFLISQFPLELEQQISEKGFWLNLVFFLIKKFNKCQYAFQGKFE